jgi:serine/threonine-protein kinase
MVAPVVEGQVLAQKYRIERVLGSGGMGIVVAARHVHLDTRVALKFIRSEATRDRIVVGRFMREARAAARLQGEHIARVVDVGTLDNGAPYLVMEYLEGMDLARLLRTHGRPRVTDAVDYIIQACDALDEAHAAGIIHRDIKPSNLFLARRRNGSACIKVLDFGISKMTACDPAQAMLDMTSTRAVLGSPLYMAPEQMRATRDVDVRADVWSLGATLYELLSGSVPFAAESVFDLCFKITQERPPPLSVVRPEVPRDLERAVLRCLQSDRDARFATPSELVAALAPFTSANAASSPEALAHGQNTGAEARGVAPAPIPTPPSAPYIRTADLRTAQATALDEVAVAVQTPRPLREARHASSLQPIAAATGSSWGTTAARNRRGRGPVIALGTVAGLIAACFSVFLVLRLAAHRVSNTTAAASVLAQPAAQSERTASETPALSASVPAAMSSMTPSADAPSWGAAPSPSIAPVSQSNAPPSLAPSTLAAPVNPAVPRNASAQPTTPRARPTAAAVSAGGPKPSKADPYANPN